MVFMSMVSCERMENERDDIQRCFNDHGLRLTRQREAIYRALAATKSHPTADDLHQAVRERERGLSLATVYNTLEAFCRVGMAQKIATGQGATRYDADCDNHLHLRSQSSGDVKDAPDEVSKLILDRLPRKALREVERKLGFQIRQVQIELVGEYVEGKARDARKEGASR